MMATSRRTKTNFKLVLVGDPAVGKTSLLLQIKRDGGENQFADNVEIFEVHSCDVTLEVWDLPNQLEKGPLPRSFYRHIDGAIIMYDLTTRTSFSNVSAWIDTVKTACHHPVKMFVVGGKSDLTSKREVYPDDIDGLERAEGLTSYVTSSKERHQISTLFTDIATLLKIQEEEALIPQTKFSFEMVFLGNAEVGKSALIRRYVDNYFTESNNPTQGATVVHRIIDIGRCKVKATILDIPGQTQLMDECKDSCVSAKAAIVMYDITDRKSFTDLPNWLNFVRENCPSVKEVFLVGGKSDLKSSTDRQQVNSRDVVVFAKQKSLKTFETSAKTGDGVYNLFETIAARVNRYQEEENEQTNRPFRGIIVGDHGVGKTTLLRSFRENRHEDDADLSTFDFRIVAESQVINVSFWDAAGAPPRERYRDVDVAIVMYDITNRPTFDNVQNWINQIRNQCPDHVKVFLVGGKSDSPSGPRVRLSEAITFARRERLLSFQTSARLGLGVDPLFRSIARSLIRDTYDDFFDRINFDILIPERRRACIFC